MARKLEAAAQVSIVARDRVIDTIRREIRVVVMVEKRLTVEQIAIASGVPVRALRTYMDNDETEAREPPTSNMLSIAVVLGERCVNAVLALIGYGGAVPLDEADELQPMALVADAMCEVGVIAQAAARGKGRISHVDDRVVAAAADKAIHDLLPFSSAGRAE